MPVQEIGRTLENKLFVIGQILSKHDGPAVLARSKEPFSVKSHSRPKLDRSVPFREIDLFGTSDDTGAARATDYDFADEVFTGFCNAGEFLWLHNKGVGLVIGQVKLKKSVIGRKVAVLLVVEKEVSPRRSIVSILPVPEVLWRKRR